MLSHGSFGKVYEAFIPSDSPLEARLAGVSQWVVKVEPSDSRYGMLENEANVLAAMQGVRGFPLMHSFFVDRDSRRGCLVMQRLRRCMDPAEPFFSPRGRVTRPPRVSKTEVYMAATHLIERLEALHLRGFLHRDVKPGNIMFEPIDDGPMGFYYLIDFGLAITVKSAPFLVPKAEGRIIGTPRYCSLNGHWGCPYSYRDDLESLVYTLLHIAGRRLPWIGMAKRLPRGHTTVEHYRAVGKCKNDVLLHPEMLFSDGTDDPLFLFYRYVRSLEQDELPDYKVAKAPFYKALGKPVNREAMRVCIERGEKAYGCKEKVGTMTAIATIAAMTSNGEHKVQPIGQLVPHLPTTTTMPVAATTTAIDLATEIPSSSVVLADVATSAAGRSVKRKTPDSQGQQGQKQTRVESSHSGFMD